MSYRIFLSPPHLCGKEYEYIKNALDSNYIAPCGEHIDLFERELATLVGYPSALAVNSATSGIHLALLSLGVKEGDTVFCSDLTFVASCNPILYLKAHPVFIDSTEGGVCTSPVALKKAFEYHARHNSLPRAVIIVDLYGHSAEWDELLPLCHSYGVPVIEDCAEALGSTYRNASCGTFGDISVFSFNGNKIITTSGGGMVLSDDLSVLEHMRKLSTQAREDKPWYEHKECGYNYRMSNISAAIGRAQLTFLTQKLKRRYEIAEAYKTAFSSLPVRMLSPCDACVPNNWLNVLYINDDTVTPAQMIAHLTERGIEARHAWKPMHMQPLFAAARAYSHLDDGFACEDIFSHALCLPSGDGLSDDELDEIISAVKECFR